MPTIKKKHKVIMLPAYGNEIPMIIKSATGQLFVPTTNHTADEHKEVKQECFNLYIISDDEIKEGDWFIKNNHIIKQATEFDLKLIEESLYRADNLTHKKIIATTNPSLNLPQIPQSFVKEYVENNGIDEVLVEYNECLYPNADLTFKSTLRTNLNNEIIIHPIKDCYTRKEVEELIYKYADYTSGELGRQEEAQQFIKEYM